MSTVLVDLDDTLLPDVAARDAVLAHVLAELGSRFEPADALQRMRLDWRTCAAKAAPQMCGVSSWEALWTDMARCDLEADDQSAAEDFQRTVWEQLTPDVEPGDAAERYRQKRSAAVVPYPWVAARLDELAGEHRLWCVTNGSGWLQRHKLALAGLTDRFGIVVVSGEVGARKETPAYADRLRTLLDEAGDEPAYLIGDRADTDGALAAALGVPFVRVEPGRPF